MVTIMKGASFLILIVLMMTGFTSGCRSEQERKVEFNDTEKKIEKISLPLPQTKGEMSLEEALLKRRSKREFLKKDLSMEAISQLLWACQGITEPSFGGRTAPSAGALYPLEVYVVTKDGVFHYLPTTHELEKVKSGDFRKGLSQACLGQTYPADAPVSFIISAVFERTSVKYGERAERYVKMETGHACQNLLLQAVALGLGAVPVGAFYDDEISKVLSLPENHKPLYVVPAGYPVE